MYIYNVSKTKLTISNEKITELKSLHYYKFIALINQFLPDILCLSLKDCKYITLGANDNIEPFNNYKDYPICIKKDVNGTQLMGIQPMMFFDNLVCLNNKIVFVPIIGEYITYDIRLHQMTLIFDINQHLVFLHDPNSKSLFNDDTTMTLLQEYITILNTILQDYGMSSYTFVRYEFDNMNINIKFLFADSIKGNCVIASMVFMILYHNIQDASYIEMLLQQTNKEEYKQVYIGMYNKLQEYLELIA
jgi:hypothetical protein